MLNYSWEIFEILRGPFIRRHPLENPIIFRWAATCIYGKQLFWEKLYLFNKKKRSDNKKLFINIDSHNHFHIHQLSWDRIRFLARLMLLQCKDFDWLLSPVHRLQICKRNVHSSKWETRTYPCGPYPIRSCSYTWEILPPKPPCP